MQTLTPSAPLHSPALADLPPRLSGGWWPTSHVQGIAVDLDRGHIYYSFTTLLVKTGLDGVLIGTVGGLSGHLGDITFDPVTRRLYGSLEYKHAAAFYIAIFDVDAIDREGILAVDADVVRTVHLAEVTADYAWTADGKPAVDGDPVGAGARTMHRHGCSGIDGTALGPRFGSVAGERLLTVAYGVYSNTERADNDHQVLLQYSTEGWWDGFGRRLDETAPHRSGPVEPDGKYFVRTGNTRFGVQNLEYDPSSQRWLLGVYPGVKRAFPNFTLFAVEAAAAAVPTELGAVLPLADAGLLDPLSGVRGWYQRADVGIAALGEGLFYLSESSAQGGLQASDVRLVRWTGDVGAPFAEVPAAAPARRELAAV